MTQPIGPPADLPGANAVDALYSTGHWLYSQQRIAHAVAVFRAMIHLAPRDERGWLALGACHEAGDQQDIALQLYATASSIATAPRCELAKARILRARGMSEEARSAIAEATRIAEELNDEDLFKLVAAERGRL
jgi:tetratricopeptide (TPR) repeat protein